jgi:hypothetical protein
VAFGGIPCTGLSWIGTDAIGFASPVYRKGLYSSNSVMGSGRASQSRMQWVESKISYMCYTFLTTIQVVAAGVNVLTSTCVPSFNAQVNAPSIWLTTIPLLVIDRLTRVLLVMYF